MRVPLTILSTIFLVEILFVPATSWSSSPFIQLCESTASLLYEKKITVTGNAVIPSEEVRAALPVTRSTFWWHLHKSEISAALKAIPLLEDAVVGRCDGSLWSCFNVQVKERRPAFIASIAKEAWLIGEDGVPIVPLSSDPRAKAFLASREKDLIKIGGILSPDDSPDVARGRIRYLKDSIAVLEGETGRKVKEITMEDSGEIKVRFEGLHFPTVFGYSGTDLSRLGREVRRFALLLPKLLEQGLSIGKVDLAFEKQAVVSLTPR